MPQFTFESSTLHLNDEQARIVQQPLDTNMRILASAGSGKTTTLTGRIAWLLQQGAKPDEIMLLTFTHNSATDMHNRLEALVGAQQILCGTFHALSQQILSKWSPTSLKDLYHVDELPLKALDFFQTPKGKKFCAKLRWIFIDEYQDINEVQDKFIKAVNMQSQSVTIVGDDAQNIYSWRGSCVDYILDFHKRFAKVVDFQLSTNYRSTVAIVAIANSVMRFIPTLPHKELMTAGPGAPVGDRPEVRFFSRTTEERDWVVEAARNATGTTVILSKYNSVLFAYEAAFLKAGIRVYMHEQGQIKGSICLSTFHSAKGLEWDNVFIVRMNDEVFPQQKDEDSVLQERRLFYVAVTRARRFLSFTYSRTEHSLSRFVREIHRPLVIFRNLPRYDLSTLTSTLSASTVDDWVRGLDGEDFRAIKALNLLPATLQEVTTIDFKDSEWLQGKSYAVPHWWNERGMAAEFADFVRAFWHREMATLRPESGGQWDRDAQRVIWTVKIAAEDSKLFEEERGLFEHLTTKFFGATEPGEPPPQIHYVEVMGAIHAYSAKPYDQATLIRIIQIVHKMRTVLYNLRFAKISLTDLQFSPIRHSPPQETRCALIEAWRHYTTGTQSLSETYLIGLCKSLATGRSGVLAELPGAKEWAKCSDFLAKIKDTVLALHTSTPVGKILCRSLADMIVDETAWFFVAGDQPNDLKRLDRLLTFLLTVNLLRQEVTVHRVCIYQMITGCRIVLDITDWSAATLYNYVEALAKAENKV